MSCDITPGPEPVSEPAFSAYRRELHQHLAAAKVKLGARRDGEARDFDSQTVTPIAAAMSMSEQTARRYLDEDTIRELAHKAAFAFVDEQPGADLFEQPRTIPVSLQVLGVVIAGLAEAGHVCQADDDSAGGHLALQMISFLGQFLHELPEGSSGPVLVPRAAVTRSIRALEITAKMLREGSVEVPEFTEDTTIALANAFERDTTTLRKLLEEPSS